MANKHVFLTLVGTVLAVSLITACGGGGGGSTATPAATSLTGTAAVGAAMGNATIKLTDGDGQSSQATSDSNGLYTFADISKFKAPVLVSATGTLMGVQKTYASLVTAVNAGGSNTANVNPITDMIVLQATGQSNAGLEGSPALIKAIDITKVKSSTDNVVAALSSVLNGIKSGSSSGYNPITSTAPADGTNPYDKVLDLVSVGSSSQVSGSTTTFNITLTDKSGTNGTITIATGSPPPTPLPAIPTAISALPIDKIPALLTSTTQIATSASSLTVSTFGNLFSDSFLNKGASKTQHVAQLTDSLNSKYMLGYKASNPVVNSCGINGTCSITFDESLGSYSGQSTQNIIWDQSKGTWLYYGNQMQADLVNYWNSNIDMWGDGTMHPGLDFGIMDSQRTYPYNSAIAIFQDKNGNVDYSVNFVQKAACPTTLSYYYGMPVDDPTVSNNSTVCNNYVNTNDTLLTTINQHIAQGGYKLIVRAYTSFNRTGTPVELVQNLTKPLLVSTQVTAADFPKVSISSDAVGPLLSIANAADYIQWGSVCMSSAVSPGYCDMTNLPPHTTEYKGNALPLQSVYRPKSIDGWIANEEIRSSYVHVHDRFGRDLSISNYIAPILNTLTPMLGTYESGCILTNVGSAKYTLSVYNTTGAGSALVSLRTQLFSNLNNSIASFLSSDNSAQTNGLPIFPSAGTCNSASTDITITGQITAQSTTEAYLGMFAGVSDNWASQVTLRLDSVTFTTGGLNVTTPAFGSTTTLGYKVLNNKLYFVSGKGYSVCPTSSIVNLPTTSCRYIDWTYLTKR